MPISTSVNCIQGFQSEVYSISVSSRNTLQGLEEAYGLIKDKFETLLRTGERNIMSISGDLAEAEDAIKHNKGVIKDIAYEVEEVKRSGIDQDSKQYKDFKKKTDGAIDNIDAKIKKLEELKQSLLGKYDEVDRANNALRKGLGDLDAIISDARGRIDRYAGFLSERERDCTFAIDLVSRLDSRLSFASGSATSASKWISIRAPEFLYEVSSSLLAAKRDILDKGGDLYRKMEAYRNVMKDEVSSSSCQHLADVLQAFEDKIDDFEERGNAFKEAGDYLRQYERMKR